MTIFFEKLLVVVPATQRYAVEVAAVAVEQSGPCLTAIRRCAAGQIGCKRGFAGGSSNALAPWTRSFAGEIVPFAAAGSAAIRSSSRRMDSCLYRAGPEVRRRARARARPTAALCRSSACR